MGSSQSTNSFGLALLGIGDVNGDGDADVLITAWFGDHGEVNEGLAFVYHGSRQGLSRKPDWTAEANQAHALFGSSAASAGDVNGDGFADVASDSGSPPPRGPPTNSSPLASRRTFTTTLDQNYPVSPG